MSSTEFRLAAVERQLRFHRAVIATLLVALVALVGYGATEGVPDVIRAKRFEVVHNNGATLIALGWEGPPYNASQINLYSVDGEQLVEISEASGGGFVGVNSPTGGPVRRVALAAAYGFSMSTASILEDLSRATIVSVGLVSSRRNPTYGIKIEQPGRSGYSQTAAQLITSPCRPTSSICKDEVYGGSLFLWQDGVPVWSAPRR